MTTSIAVKNFVDLNTNQNVSGNKNFNGTTKIYSPVTPSNLNNPLVIQTGILTTNNIPDLNVNGIALLSGGNNYVSAISSYNEGNGAQFKTLSFVDHAATNSLFAGFKARGSYAAPTSVNLNDNITSFISYGYDGSAFRGSAAIRFLVDAVVSAGSVPQAIRLETLNIPRVHISSNGNIGIATTTPGARLQVSGGVAITASTAAATDPGAGNLSVSGNTILQGMNIGYRAVAANYTAVTTDCAISIDCSGGGRTITLPTAVGNAGKLYRIKKTDASANVVTVATTASQTIDGAATLTISAQNTSQSLVSTGTNWLVF